LGSVIELEEKLTAIDPVGGWRRWLGYDADRDRGLLVSRPADASAQLVAGDGEGGAPQATLLRHPGLARVVEAEADGEGRRVVEEVGQARSLSDGRCRLPRGEALTNGLLGLLEALAYLHRQGLSHGAVARATVFSDGRALLLTGVALGPRASASPSADVRDWARLTSELLDGARGGANAELLREAARQVVAAVDDGRTLDAARVAQAIHRAQGAGGGAAGGEDAGAPADADSDAEIEADTDGPERSRQMKALLAVLNVIGNFILGSLTTVLTIALIGGAIALGVIWFLGRLPQEVRVPMVVGLERKQAEDRLKQDALEVGRVRSVYREDVDPGYVAATTPPEGMVVREGREVTLVVSMGAAQVKVPRVVGLRLDEAEKVLEKQGLALVDGGKIRSGSPEGEIVHQDPPAGRKIAQGQRVMAQVSGGPEFGVVEVEGDDEDGEPQRMVFRRVEVIVPRGDALQRVVVREGYDDDLETTYDRLRRPGDRVKLDTYGRPGKQIKVLIEGDEVFKTQL